MGAAGTRVKGETEEGMKDVLVLVADRVTAALDLRIVLSRQRKKKNSCEEF